MPSTLLRVEWPPGLSAAVAAACDRCHWASNECGAEALDQNSCYGIRLGNPRKSNLTVSCSRLWRRLRLCLWLCLWLRLLQWHSSLLGRSNDLLLAPHRPVTQIYSSCRCESPTCTHARIMGNPASENKGSYSSHQSQSLGLSTAISPMNAN